MENKKRKIITASSKGEQAPPVCLAGEHYYSSGDSRGVLDDAFPEECMSARHARMRVLDYSKLDFKPELNTSSYVNVFQEEEEQSVALHGLHINLADQTVYPGSYKLHDKTLNLVASLWHCPKPKDFDEFGCYPGAGTVGSTEACLLAGLALKFRWRAWNAKRKGLDEYASRRTMPNLVISTTFQAAWEKLFKYMDVEPRFVLPTLKNFTIDPAGVAEAIDENTCGVVVILGEHYSGHYEDVGAVAAAVRKVNAAKGFQVALHVDAASGGFVAPFQRDMKPWDFRVPEVMSISASGHKFGESMVGTGWVVWRQREDLSEHVAISVSYLGGKGESYTLNFSRPASGPMVQLYKFLRLGRIGYQAKVDSQMATAKFLRDGLKKMTIEDGSPRFVMLDYGDENCLPVVAACLNPALNLSYDDIDFQHMVAARHWYVCAYALAFNDPWTEKKRVMFSDTPMTQTMFRIVVKSDLTMGLAVDLLNAIQESIDALDKLDLGYLAIHRERCGHSRQHHSGQTC